MRPAYFYAIEFSLHPPDAIKVLKEIVVVAEFRRFGLLPIFEPNVQIPQRHSKNVSSLHGNADHWKLIQPDHALHV